MVKVPIKIGDNETIINISTKSAKMISKNKPRAKVSLAENMPPVKVAQETPSTSAEVMDESEIELSYNVPTHNPWGILTNTQEKPENNTNDNQTVSKKPAYVPPVVLARAVIDHSTLCSKIRQTIGNDFSVRYTNKNTKIFAKSKEMAAALKQRLRDDLVHFHTFTPRDERLKNIVMKAAPNMDVAEISDELKQNGFDVMEVVNLKNGSGYSYSYLIKVPKTVNLGVLKQKIKHVGHTIVKWESYAKKSSWSQCYNCQEFGHGSSNCFKQAVCVKCAGKHHTKDCLMKKGDGSAPKCVNCNNEHPANYSKCPALEAYLKEKYTRPPQAKASGERKQQPPASTATQNYTRQGVSFADTVKPPLDIKTTTQSEFKQLADEFRKLGEICNISKMLSTVKTLNIKLAQASSERDQFLIFSEVLSSLDG